MTAQTAVQKLIDTFADWLKHRRELNELYGMNRSDLDRIASDFRVSSTDLVLALASARRRLRMTFSGVS